MQDIGTCFPKGQMQSQPQGQKLVHMHLPQKAVKTPKLSQLQMEEHGWFVVLTIVYISRPPFKGKSSQEGAEYARKHRLCFSCLIPNHRGKECKRLPNCAECHRHF